jgi:hypothetical protein
VPRLIVDATLFTNEWIGFNAAAIDHSIVMKSSAYKRLPIKCDVLGITKAIGVTAPKDG